MVYASRPRESVIAVRGAEVAEFLRRPDAKAIAADLAFDGWHTDVVPAGSIVSVGVYPPDGIGGGGGPGSNGPIIE